MVSSNGRILNAISVDVEDWLQSTIDPELPLTARFQRSTEKVLAAFADRGIRGTFFVLGLAAEKAPQVVRQIQAAGHEIQSHGYGHRLVYTLTPAEFRTDLERAKKLLEDLTGRRVFGYRAPAFTITRQNLWALDVLAETGHDYDSSVFPLRTGRYGIADAPRHPHRLRTPAGHELIELPVASYHWLGRRWPVGGGGYFRLCPYAVLRRGVRQINADGQPATIYMHPYEYDPFEFAELPYRVSRLMRLHQGLGRRGFPGKIERLLTDFPFGAIEDVLRRCHDLPVYAHEADGRTCLAAAAASPPPNGAPAGRAQAEAE